MLNTSEYESMTWIGFGYSKDIVSFVLHPLLIAFFPLYILPLAGTVVLYTLTFSLYIWKKIYNIQGDVYNELWNKPRLLFGNVMILCGKILHGYEIIGMENIPEGPALIIYYHGAATLDYIFFISTLYVTTGRVIHSVMHCFFYWIPGVKLLLDVIGCIEGTQTNCSDVLKKGHLLGIAPGGLREQNFSSKNYNLEWNSRTGFAQVALKNKVPIIPMFTVNLREAYRSVGKTRLTRWMFEHFRYIVLPIYGGFPVKLRTYFGEPIPYDPNLTAKELAEKTKIAIENLRDKHQKLPGNICRALWERFDENKKDA